MLTRTFSFKIMKEKYTYLDALRDQAVEMHLDRIAHEERQYQKWEKEYDAAGPMKKRWMSMCSALNTPFTIPVVVFFSAAGWGVVRAIIDSLN